MSAPLHDQMEAALTDLRAQQDRIRDFGAAMAARTTTVASTNRMISVTVDSGGRLTNLSFEGNRYRALAPAELGALVVGTVAEAQEQANQAAMAAMAELLPEALDFSGLAGGELDLDGMVESAVRLAGQPVFGDEPAAAPSGQDGPGRSAPRGSDPERPEGPEARRDR
jgi:hypothetical protein